MYLSETVCPACSCHLGAIIEIKLPIEAQMNQLGFIFCTDIVSKYLKPFPTYVNILYI
jgi:hypothetical protein